MDFLPHNAQNEGMKYLPFPLEVYDHPLVKRLHPTAGGLLRFLVEDYWISGLPLPEQDFALMRLSNGAARVWQIHRDAIKEALNVVYPDVKKKGNLP